MKHLFIFSPIAIALGIVPAWFYSLEARHWEMSWLATAFKVYVFVGTPYAVLSALTIAYSFTVGKRVSRLESGIALAMMLGLGYAAYMIVQGLGRAFGG